MTIPTQMNCAHDKDGWCLACVRELADERDTFKKQTLDLAFDSGDYSEILGELDVTKEKLALALSKRDALQAQVAVLKEAAKRYIGMTKWRTTDRDDCAQCHASWDAEHDEDCAYVKARAELQGLV